LGTNTPSGENRGGTPAGERARKRRAAQAAFSVARPARRLRAGHEILRLPAFRFLYFLPEASRKELFFVIAGLDPAIHVTERLKHNSGWLTQPRVNMDRRSKAGGDEENLLLFDNLDRQHARANALRE
jgi:hypothetical protein